MRPSTLARLLFAGTVLVQLLVLYLPRAPAAGGPGLDKLVHAAVFGAVLWAGLRCGFPTVPLVVALLAHAVLSEVLQERLLPNRSGDPLDVVADTVGVLLALAIARRDRALSRAG